MDNESIAREFFGYHKEEKGLIWVHSKDYTHQYPVIDETRKLLTGGENLYIRTFIDTDTGAALQVATFTEDFGAVRISEEKVDAYLRATRNDKEQDNLRHREFRSYHPRSGIINISSGDCTHIYPVIDETNKSLTIGEVLAISYLVDKDTGASLLVADYNNIDIPQEKIDAYYKATRNDKEVEELKEKVDKYVDNEEKTLNVAKTFLSKDREIEQLKARLRLANSLADEHLKSIIPNNAPVARKVSTMFKKAAVLLTIGVLAGNIPFANITDSTKEFFRGSDTVLTGRYHTVSVCADCKENFGTGVDVAICGSCGGDNIIDKVAADLYRSRPWPMFDKVVGTRFHNGNGTSTVVLDDGDTIIDED